MLQINDLISLKFICVYSYFIIDYGDVDVAKLLDHYLVYLTAACEDVEDFAGEALVEWDDLKSQIYGR